jgi:hypothetical protein
VTARFGQSFAAGTSGFNEPTIRRSRMSASLDGELRRPIDIELSSARRRNDHI